MMDAKMIAKLEEMGGKRWTKGSMDRMYFNARDLGLELKYYETGNVKDAKFRGAQLSNSDGRRYKAAKTYVDLATGEVHSDYDALAEAVREMIYGKKPEETPEEKAARLESTAAKVAETVIETIDKIEDDAKDKSRRHPGYDTIAKRLPRIREAMMDRDGIRAAAEDVVMIYGSILNAKNKAIGLEMTLGSYAVGYDPVQRRLLGL